MNIPFIRSVIPRQDQWVQRLEESYAQSRFANFGPLERDFAGRCRSRYASPGYEVVTCSNATAGLTAVLLALAEGMTVTPKVVIPSFTFPRNPPCCLAGALHPHPLRRQPSNLGHG